MNRRAFGQKIEKQVAAYLKKAGLRLLTSNFQAASGEIDLIMRDQDTLVFVEVRYRQHQQYGGAAASVDWRKQQKLIKTAGLYLQQHPHQGPCRFDVIAVKSLQPIDLEWIKDAFQAM